jgi:hypothetical protein
MIQYVASDIVIDSKGDYRSKILTFSSPKTGTGGAVTPVVVSRAVSGSFGASASGATVSVCGAGAIADASGIFSLTANDGSVCDDLSATLANHTCTVSTNGPAVLSSDVSGLGGECVAGTRAFECAPKAATGTVWNTSSGYVQTWNGSAWSPADSTTAYDSVGSTTECRYKCDTGYVWNSGSGTCDLVGTEFCGAANKTYAYGSSSYASDTLCLTGFTADPATPSFPTSGSSVSWICTGT